MHQRCGFSQSATAKNRYNNRSVPRCHLITSLLLPHPGKKYRGVKKKEKRSLLHCCDEHTGKDRNSERKADPPHKCHIKDKKHYNNMQKRFTAIHLSARPCQRTKTTFTSILALAFTNWHLSQEETHINMSIPYLG